MGGKLIVAEENGSLGVYNSDGSTSIDGVNCGPSSRTTKIGDGMVSLLDRLFQESTGKALNNGQSDAVERALITCRELGGDIAAKANEVWGRLNLGFPGTGIKPVEGTGSDVKRPATPQTR